VRAVRVHAFGQGLQVDDVPEPEPGPDEDLFEVRFAGVNPIDVWLTEGTVAGGTQKLPLVPGVEAAGTIDDRAVLVHGAGLGIRRDGLYRERAAVPREAIIPLPDGLPLEKAAGLGVPGPTAWSLVHQVAKVTIEDRVLVLGASGGVGSLVVQLARAAGATVWGQTSSPDKAAFVQEAGAEKAVVAGAGDLAEAAKDLEATVVIDPLADGFTSAAVTLLQPFGRIALYGASAGPRTEFDLRTLYRKSIQLLTYSGTIEPEDRVHQATRGALDAAARGELRVFVDEILPLEQAGEAHRRIKARQVRGKLLLAP